MTAACCTSPASGNCYWPCLKPRERLEPSHSRGVYKPPGRLHPVHAPAAQTTSKRGGDQLAPPEASNSNLNIAKLYLPHQHVPTGRLPGFHQSHPRPLVSLPVKRQTHEIERRWRRPSFDRSGPETPRIAPTVETSPA